MKKIFLIPLMTLLTCVMAWGAEVGTFAELQAAVPTTGSAEITLTDDISTDATALTVPDGVTITLNLNGHSITAEATPDPTDYMALNNPLKAIDVAEGGTLTIKGTGSINCHYIIALFNNYDAGQAINAASGANLTLEGAADINGMINASSANVTIGTNYTGKVNGVSSLPMHCVSGGYWISNPGNVLAEGYNVEAVEIEGVTYQHVIESNVVYVALIGNQGYETLQAAVDAASDGDIIELLADATAVTVGKEVTFVTVNMSTFDSYDASAITAAEGYTIAEDPTGLGINVYDAKEYALYDFLTKEGTDSYTVSSNVDIAEWPFGAVSVVGTKTLTIAEGVTVTYKRQGSLANIVVDNGAELTILGSGTFKYAETAVIADRSRCIDVDGTLSVGVQGDASNCPKFIVGATRGSAIMTNRDGVTTINNFDLDVQNQQTGFSVYGKMAVNSGRIVTSGNALQMLDGSNVTINNLTIEQRAGGPSWYAIINYGGYLTINNANVTTYSHGAVSFQSVSATGVINGGTFVVNHNSSYPLYASWGSMVNVMGGKFLCNGTPNRAVDLGNEDQMGTQLGLVNVYGGEFSSKVFVQGGKNTLPSGMSEDSEFAQKRRSPNGGYISAPAGYEYYNIVAEATGAELEIVDAEAHAAGYRFKVISKAQETQDATGTTIPWQQASTWTDTDLGDVIPATTTVVTIPEGKTVVVSKDEANTNAVAQQIFIGDGAKLTVEAGTTLTVGEGGVNIANGGQMIVKDGAVVRVGKSGLVTTEEEALVIENTQTKAGVFMIDPAVTENTQPKATVKLESKAYHDETKDIFHWQHFAIPTVGVPDEFKMPVQTAIYDLDENNAWKTLSGMSELGTPFKGYNLTNWATAKGTVYEFYGNIIGNGDGKANFTGRGYNFCGNSYTAPIDIVKMLQDIKNNTTVDVEPTITIYDTENDKYQAVTVASIENASWMGTPVFTQIAPMQGFFLNLRTNEAGEYEVIDYSNSVWGNPSIATGGMLAPARHEANDNKGIRMVVAANGREDDVLMVESEDYTATFDDGADATKKMSERSFNLYANINNEKQAVVATNNMENTILGFESVEGGEYTIRFYTNDVEGEYYLLDIVTGAKMAIANDAEYKFAQDANVANAARFEIVSVAKVTTSIENVEEAAKATGIYTITGQYIGRDFTILPAGVYVINGQKVVK